MASKRSASQRIAQQLVQPGVDAMQAIHQGEIDMTMLVNLHMLTRLAERARQRKMVAPAPGALDAVVHPIAATFYDDDPVSIDPQALEQAERWIRTLRDQLGRASVANLQGLIEELIQVADQQDARAECSETTSPAEE
ncbi:hypothetical protein BUE93_21685 [Chromobacterium amazonense]|uniref:Uncharacterized protein n=1 Tax=Chromobacterium amazonense TaxID=1382803 RepID=A0A2S9WYN1_9NEIS|nr:hypothetical protein [Chromobacterium amazonense]PRP68575.1 hypothetical protein BUE93_21685 [Chromobacterium amazonense]